MLSKEPPPLSGQTAVNPTASNSSEMGASGPDTAVAHRAAEERRALNAVLASSTFKKNPRLASLLEYICQKYFEGETDTIKEYSIAADVFRRPVAFDQTTDSIVRVEVHRLRRKLREYYETEGAQEPIEIVVATGHYLPEFVDRIPNAAPGMSTARPMQVDSKSDSENSVTGSMERFSHRTRARLRLLSIRSPRNLEIAVYVLTAAVATLIPALFWVRYTHAHVSRAPQLEAASSQIFAMDTAIRIRCGYTKKIYKDQDGNVWTGDRDFIGGWPVGIGRLPIARTRDPELYMTFRSGTFSYVIPLAAGTYELRLYFAETTYGQQSALGGGENSRVFDVKLNGKPLLTQFDIVADAGSYTADVRAFKDVHPGPDGNLHLDFSGVLGLPIISGIEIIPSQPGLLLPIRMVAENNFFVDKSGNLWSPDSYFSGGILASDRVTVEGTDNPGLYTGGRYGNFNYALPVDQGTYALTLYFSEKYWGVGGTRTTGSGHRVFDVYCNGVALIRNLDIAKEVGPAHALQKTFHDLHPNAQGKLIVSLVPDKNYATVDAVEVEDESR